MPIETVVIRLTGDTKDLDSTLSKLEKLGKTDKENNEQFKKTHDAQKQRHTEMIDYNTKLSRSLEDLTKGVIAAFAVEKILEGIKEFGSESIKAFEEAEKASNQLKFAILNVNGETKKSFNELIEQSERLSKSINNLYSPKQIQQAQSQLALAKVSTEQIMKAMPRIADMSAKSGKSLESVTEAFVKGIQGQTRGLVDFGIKFKDTGDTIDNFNKIMEKTGGFVGGAAFAMDDLGNKSEEAKNKMEIMQEEIEGLASVWEKMKMGMLGATEGFMKFFDVIDQHNSALDIHKARLQNAADIYEKYTDEALGNRKALITDAIVSQKQVVDGLRQEFDAVQKLHGSYIEHDGLMRQEVKDAHDKLQVQERLLLHATEEYTAINKISEAREEQHKKDIEQAAQEKSIKRDLTKFSQQDLQHRLESLKDEAEKEIKYKSQKEEIIEHLDEQGRATEIARTESQIKKNEENNKKLLEQAKKFAADLEKIRREIADTESGARIESIDNEQAKKIAQEDKNFGDKINKVKDQQKTLKEIILKGNSEQRKQAEVELKETNTELELLQRDHLHNITKINDDAATKEKEDQKKRDEDLLKLKIKDNEVESKALLIALKQKLADKKITQEQYDLEADKLKLGEMERQYKLEVDAGQQDIDLAQKIAEQKIKIQTENAKDEKALRNKTVKELQDFAEKAISIYESIVQGNIAAIDHQEQVQKDAINQQLVLAAAGKQNTLAQEVKAEADLEKERAQAQKKLVKAKELETFLNSVAAFSKDDPKSAVLKAVAQLALVKGVEAAYAEEGGLVGGNMQKSKVYGARFSRMHPGGGDVLLHAQTGEGILSRKEIVNMGGATAFLSMKNALKEKQIPLEKVNIFSMSNNRGVEARLDSLENTIKNKKETSIDFDNLNRMVTEEIENGIKKITIHAKRLRIGG
jgi:hypothetical protein